MPAGTIMLTSGSTAVTGTGTNFATELKVNDFVVAVVGGVTYTLGVQAVGSATALTLTTAYNGPTTSGLAWTALPNSALVGITAQVAADVAKAIRGFNFDKVNWQKIFSSDTSVTVTLPDLTKFTGPSWGYLATQFVNKVDKSALGDAAAKNTGTTPGTLAAGDDSRITGSLQKSGGTLTGNLIGTKGSFNTIAALNGAYELNFNNPANGTIVVNRTSNVTTIDYGNINITNVNQIAGNSTWVSTNFTANNVVTEASGNMSNNGLRIWGSSRDWDVYLGYYLVSGQYHSFRIIQNGSATFQLRSNGAAYAVSFNPTSDSNLKFNKSFIDSALMKSMSLRGMTYDINGDRKAGVIAQDALRVLPESVTKNTEAVVLEDGTILNETLSLDYSAIAGLHTEAIKELVPLMMEMLTSPEAAKEKLSSLIAAINSSTEDANPTDMRMEWALLNPPSTPVLGEAESEGGEENQEENGS